MKNIWLQIIVIILVLSGTGLLLERPRTSVMEDLVANDFVGGEISQDDQLKIGQTGTAVALGGLRSLVAAALNLQAFSAFSEQDWVEVEQLYNVIVVLQPKNTYYWENAGWHMAYNAYSDFQHKFGLTNAQRELKKQAYHRKGEEFFLRATKEKPEESSLWVELGRLFSNNYQPMDLKKAAGYYKAALDCPDVTDRDRREYFYTLARVKGAEQEAYTLGQELIKKEDNKIKPSMRSIYFSTALLANPNMPDHSALIKEAFDGNKGLAYVDIVNYWLRPEIEQFPKAHLRSIIGQLAEELNVPDQSNPLINPNMEMMGTLGKED